MMTLGVVAALLGASCSAFAPKTLRSTPRRTRRQSLQMNVITERPARAALAAAYVGFAGAIATFPGEFNNPADIQLIQDALNDPTSMTVHNQIVATRRREYDIGCTRLTDLRTGP